MRDKVKGLLRPLLAPRRRRPNGVGTLARARSRGQALVEFALVVTTLLFLLVGLIDVGRLYITMLTLDSAAAEGATYAALRPTETATARQRALDEGADSPVVDLNQMTVSIVQPPQIQGGQPITATASYNFTPLFPFLSGNSFTFHKTAVATILQ